MFIIAGLYRHQRLKAPKSNQTRPTANRLREAVFNICQHAIEDARFLDLFAGSGAMGLEALSRGAQSATFIDAHSEATACIKANVKQLNVQNQCQIFRGDIFAMLQLLHKQQQTFDIIYVDPPYRTPIFSSSIFYSTQIIHWIDTHALLSAKGRLFIEEDFNSQPQIELLQTLYLKDSRRMGQSVLQQYENKKQSS